MNKGKRAAKKAFALLLSFVMVVCMMPSMAFAEGNTVPETSNRALLSEFSVNSKNLITSQETHTISPSFSPDCFEYEVIINTPIRRLAIVGGLIFNVKTECQDAEIKAIYTNSSKKEQTVTEENGVLKLIKCVNIDKASAPNGTLVAITVTPPEDSELQATTYNFRVKLKDDDRLMGIKYGEAAGNTSKSFLDPASATNSTMEKSYSQSLNVSETQKQIAFALYTCDNNVEVSVNGTPVTDGKFLNPPYTVEYRTPAYNLKYGANTFLIRTQRKGSSSPGKEYTITVNRARPLMNCEFSVEDGGIIRNSLISEGERNTIDGYTYAETKESKIFKLKATVDENCIVTYDIPATKENKGKYESKIIGEDGLELNRPTYVRDGSSDYYGRKKMSPVTAKIYVTRQSEDDEDIYDEYTVNIFARMPDGANEVSEALCAPGQYVNGTYGSVVDYTLLADINTDNLYNIHSLGAFGGYITYKFDTPIKNDPNNKYGVDFVVYGNRGPAAEPAAISVSKDGKTWYNLAGSEYYEPATDWNYWVTYNKGTDEGISTRMASLQAKDGAENWLTFRGDAYYPVNSLHEKISGITLGDSYTLSGVCTYNGVGTRPTYAFGYADSTGNGDVDPLNIPVENPYVHGAQYMDLSWAVDDEGNPVVLDEVNYVKATNCELYFSTAFGENSSEIGGITKVNTSRMPQAVGVTDGLKSLKINGVEYSAEDFTTGLNGQQKILNIDLNDSSVLTLNVEATGSADDNIWINNQRSVGEGSRKIILDSNGQRVIRIIVQNGEKEPTIYVLKFTGGGDASKNADLEKVTITPGDITLTESDFIDGSATYKVDNNVEKVAVAASALNSNSAIVLKTTSNSAGIPLEDSIPSETISLEEGENILTLEVTSEDKSVVKTYTLKIIRNESASSDPDKIQVHFSFSGDVAHGFDADGNPAPGHKAETWIPSTTLTVPKGSTVKYITDMMLYNAGIEFISDKGTYISDVKHPTSNVWISQFTNGQNSGWMYRINGVISNQGYADKVLQNGDTVLWFYADDYTKETGFEGGGWDIPGETENVSAAQDLTATIKDGSAAASVSASDMNKLIDSAVKDKAASIDLNVKGADKASSVSVEIPKASLTDIATRTDAALNLKTPLGNVTMDKNAMKEAVNAASGSDLTIVLEKQTAADDQKTQLGDNAAVTKVTILSGGKEITDLGAAKIKLSLPISDGLKDKTIAAVYTDAEGKLVKVTGKTVTIDGRQYYQIETSKPETFTLAEAAKIDEAIAAQAGETDEEKLERIKKGVQNTTIKITKTSKGKGWIRINYRKSKGYKVDYYEVFRKTGKNTKFTKKAFYKTKKNGLTGWYKNTKSLKKGKRYYYKIRGVRVLNGKKYYTKWSNTVYRIAK